MRTRGTLGGSLANNDPAACWPAAVLGLGATVHTDRRQIAADDFFLGLYETALQPGELITAVSFPVPKRAAYVKFKQPASRFALVGVFVSDGPQGVRVAVTGAGPCVFRAGALEAALAKGFSAAGAGRRQAAGGRPEQRPARQRGLPRAPDRRAGPARGGAGRVRAASAPRATFLSMHAFDHVPLYELLVYGPTRRLDSVARVERHDAPNPRRTAGNPGGFFVPDIDRQEEPGP